MTGPRPPRFLSINTATALAVMVGPAAYIYLWRPRRLAAVLAAFFLGNLAIDAGMAAAGLAETPLVVLAALLATIGFMAWTVVDVRKQVVTTNLARFPDRPPAPGAWGFRVYAGMMAATLVGAIALRAIVVEARRIPSESMLPTLQVGDRVLVDKVGYAFRGPARGDVILFAPPARAMGGDTFLKRVVALPGERVAIKAGKVWIDGRALEEPYVAEPIRYAQPDWAGLGMPGGEVPPGAVFVLGDNRNNSNDSHVYGAVPIGHVLGRVAYRFEPAERAGTL